MTALQRVWVDHRISPSRWENFYGKLMDDWPSVAMYSTVILAMDIGFLSVPSVSRQISGSVTIVSIYFYIFCIVGSLVVYLCLTRQHQFADTAVSRECCIESIVAYHYNKRLQPNSSRRWHGLRLVPDLWHMCMVVCYVVVGVSTMPFWVLSGSRKSCASAACCISCLHSFIMSSRLWPPGRSHSLETHAACFSSCDSQARRGISIFRRGCWRGSNIGLDFDKVLIVTRLSYLQNDVYRSDSISTNS
ncbi:hypothetical protein BDR05DRAFT_289467 [Suillus weaverae]|nr:hypothetical protein BDR05DRAFT_289467 [Suillus weaverae]